MTGDELFNLRRGNNVKVICPFYNFKEGDILKVELVNLINESIYCRSLNKPKWIGKQVFNINISDALNNLSVTDEHINIKNIINLPFTIDDIVWFMCHDKACQGKIINYYINSSMSAVGKPSIKYEIIFKNYENNNDTINIPSYKCFNTKEELLKSL